MSEKKKYNSDTLSQQRKAREEFLELKKIQNGEISAPPPPSALQKKPETVKEKTKNFWYYYRWWVFAFVFLAVALAILIKQCTSRINYDLTVAVYTSDAVSDNSCEKMSEYFEKLGDDINGDGEVHIQVINCSYSKNANQQSMMMVNSKIQTIIAAEPKAVLFITDDTTYEFLSSISDSVKLFETDGVMLNNDFYKSCDTDKIFKLPADLKISRRALSDTFMSDNKTAARCYEAAGKILDGLSR